MNQERVKMYDEIKLKLNSEVQKNGWLNDDKINQIIYQLQNYYYDYSKMNLFKTKRNSISFIGFNEISQKEGIIFFQNQKKTKDNTNMPQIITEKELNQNITMTEYDFEQYSKTEKEYSFKDIIDASQDLEFVKIIKENIMQDQFVRNLSLCTNLIKFSLSVEKITNDEEEKKNCLINIAKDLKKCLHLQSIKLEIIQGMVDVSQVVQFVIETTQIESLNKYYLTISDIKLDLNEIETIGNSFRNFKKLTKLETHFWLNNEKEQPGKIYQIYNSVSSIESLKNLTIDIEGNNVQTIGAQMIGKYIENLKNLTQLKIDLWSNNIKYEGLIQLVDSISKLQSLSHLQLFIWYDLVLQIMDNSLSYEKIGEALKKLSDSSQINRLDLIISQNSGIKDIDHLSRIIRQLNQIYQLQIDPFLEFYPNEKTKLIQNIKKNKRLVIFNERQYDCY